MPPTFDDIVTTEAQLREVIGYPMQRSLSKTLTALDEHCRAFITRSPLVLIASADANGNMDVSPKGDPPGFVQVLDERTLAIPDRPGNRRADTFTNILQNPRVGLFFLLPGNQETLRVSGTAMIVRDLWLREQMVMQGKLPNFALVVMVEAAFLHCGKCIIRSKFWDAEGWPELDGLASFARMLVDQTKLNQSEAEVQAVIEKSYRDTLY